MSISAGNASLNGGISESYYPKIAVASASASASAPTIDFTGPSNSANRGLEEMLSRLQRNASRAADSDDDDDYSDDNDEDEDGCDQLLGLADRDTILDVGVVNVSSSPFFNDADSQVSGGGQ